MTSAQKKIEWVHGLEGSPAGKKVGALRAAGLQIDAGDYSGQSLAERVATLSARTDDGEKRLLLGSSYGGLTAAIVAQRHPERFFGLVLCAPALAHLEPPVQFVTQHRAPPPFPTVVLHSTTDKICPFSASEAYAKRSGDQVRLVAVVDNHALEGSLALLVAEVKSLLAQIDVEPSATS